MIDQAIGYNPKDRVYITPLTVASNPNINMLLCDSCGVLTMSHVDEWRIEAARQMWKAFTNDGKRCAVVEIELEADNNSVTQSVEISHEDVIVLSGVEKLALSNEIVDGKIPKAYIPHINKMINGARINCLQQGNTPKVLGAKIEPEFVPALHLIPLNPKTNIPVVFSIPKEHGQIESTLAGITTEGRIAYLPIQQDSMSSIQMGIEIPLLASIQKRIDQKFPNHKDVDGNKVQQFVVAAVRFNDQHAGNGIFIFEVWGFNRVLKELDDFYKQLASLYGIKVGHGRYSEVEHYFTSQPVKRFINELIGFLRIKLDWTNYVKNSIDIASSDPSLQ